MTDGLEFERVYQDEVENFVAKDAGVRHEDLMASLILKHELDKLYRGETHFVNTAGLDDDHPDLRALRYANK